MSYQVESRKKCTVGCQPSHSTRLSDLWVIRCSQTKCLQASFHVVPLIERDALLWLISDEHLVTGSRTWLWSIVQISFEIRSLIIWCIKVSSMKMEAIIVYEDGSNSVHCFCIIYRLEVKKSRITRLETYNCRAWFEANTLPERNLYSGGGYEISRTLRLLYLKSSESPAAQA